MCIYHDISQYHYALSFLFCRGGGGGGGGGGLIFTFEIVLYFCQVTVVLSFSITFYPIIATCYTHRPLPVCNINHT